MAVTWNGAREGREVLDDVRRSILRALAAGTGLAKQQCTFGHGLITGTYQRSIGFDELGPGRFVFGSFGGRHNSGERVPYAAEVDRQQGQISNGWEQVRQTLRQEFN